VRAAFSFPGDGQLPPPRLGRALLLAVRRAGVMIVEGIPVAAVHLENGSAAGVETPWGLLKAEAVVYAGGVRAGLLAGAPPLPVVPARSAHLLLDAAGDPDRPAHLVHGSGCGLVPRRDGTLVASAPGRGRSLDSRLTADEARALLTRASSIVPAASAYTVISGWSQAEAVAADGLPLLGETAVPGLLAAAGEGRDEILLAPAAARLLADLLTGRTPPIPCAPYSPARFGL
jgi:glycine oxidase